MYFVSTALGRGIRSMASGIRCGIGWDQ